MTDTRGTRRTLQGHVTSDKMDKTITVLVVRTFQHPKYKKYVRRREKHHAHDEKNAAKIGDLVIITECRPLSLLKRWRLTEILESTALAEQSAAEAGGAA
jgi:small subunit ribosomal protein S17